MRVLDGYDVFVVYNLLFGVCGYSSVVVRRCLLLFVFIRCLLCVVSRLLVVYCCLMLFDVV